MATQIDYNTQIKNAPTIPDIPGVVASDYQWSFTPPTNLALVSGVESTATFTTLPTGIVAASANKHYVSVVYATSSHVGFLITAVDVALKTIKFTPTISVAGAGWTLRSASGGIQEAIYANVGDYILVPPGTIQYDALKVWVTRANVTVRGAGKKATTLTFNNAGADGFWSDTYGYEIHDIRFEALTGTNTAGAVASLVGSTAKYNGEADITVTGCEFYNMYDVVIYNCPGGFIRFLNNMVRGVKRHGVYHKSTSAGAIQICDNYFDGRDSTGIIWIEGTLGGGVIADNWMQASLAHIVVSNVAGTPVNELVISGNILDQDTAATGCVVIEGTGVEGTSHNNIQILNNFIASFDYGVLAQNVYFVNIVGNRFRIRGTDAGIVFGGTVCGKSTIKSNTFNCEAAAYAIQLSATSFNQITITGNSGNATVSCLGFIGIAGAGSSVFINGNNAGVNFTRLINDVAATGAGEFVCRNNIAQNIPYTAVAPAGSIAIPFVDEDQVIGLSTSTATITAMTGVTARSGNKVSFITAGAQVWGTSTAGDNCVAKAYTASAAGNIITFYKFTDNYWYPTK